MRSKILILILLLLLAGTNIIHAQGETGDLLGRVNNLRASLGRAPYNLNGALSAAAQSQAQWMVDSGSVSHTRPDGSGPRTRALNAGYPSTQVSENIYGGTNASVDSAWVFWVNSGIHYAGLVNAAYNDVGIGVARGSWGAAYVMVFGNSGGPPPPPPQSSSGNTSGNNSAASAPAAPPSYVVGTDENGNIMHQVQPGDTLGDIALIYGYTWDDLPAMMALNGLTDVHDLEVGSIFLVPSRANMAAAAQPASDVPVSAMLATPEDRPTRTPIPATITPYVALQPMREATLVVTPLEMMTAMPTPMPAGIATAGNSALPEMLAEVVTIEPTPQGTQIAQLPTEAPLTFASSAPLPVRSNSTQWIIVAVVVQLFVLVIAGVEYTRRARRKKR